MHEIKTHADKMEAQTIKQQSDAREQRAKLILEHSKPECLDENTYLVPSQFDSPTINRRRKYGNKSLKFNSTKKE